MERRPRTIIDSNMCSRAELGQGVLWAPLL